MEEYFDICEKNNKLRNSNRLDQEQLSMMESKFNQERNEMHGLDVKHMPPVTGLF
jgi:hypothetical protein